MQIPEPFNHIIKDNYKKANFDSDWITNFINSCFSELIKELHITDYQARATKTGKMFEYIFGFIMKERFGIELVADYPIKKACMERGGSLDFGIIKNGKVLCGIEAKGSDVGSSVRPALKRTDTMKKAISQAYQFKRAFPMIPFFIVTNVKPISGNSKCMMELAEGDIVDRFIDITNKNDLNYLVKTLKGIDKSNKAWFSM